MPLAREIVRRTMDGLIRRGSLAERARMSASITDAKDLKILALLRDDGRMSYEAIAEEVGLAQSTVGDRVNRLEKTGVIKRFTVDIDAEVIGMSVTAFLFIEKASTIPADEIEAELREMPEVLELHRVTGDSFWLAKVKTEDLDGLTELVERSLQERTGIDFSEKHVSMLEVKEASGVPLDVARGEREA